MHNGIVASLSGDSSPNNRITCAIRTHADHSSRVPGPVVPRRGRCRARPEIAGRVCKLRQFLEPRPSKQGLIVEERYSVRLMAGLIIRRCAEGTIYLKAARVLVGCCVEPAKTALFHYISITLLVGGQSQRGRQPRIGI